MAGLINRIQRLETRLFIYGLCESKNVDRHWSALINLDNRTRHTYSSLPPRLRCSDGTADGQCPLPTEIVSVKSLYCLCQVLPQLSMVVFLREQSSSHQGYIHVCSQIAVRSINAYSDFLTAFLTSGDVRLSFIPPFTGFCSFLSVSIYLAYLLQVQEFEDPTSPFYCLLKERILSHLLLLHHLRSYWAPVKRMVSG